MVLPLALALAANFGSFVGLSLVILNIGDVMKEGDSEALPPSADRARLMFVGADRRALVNEALSKRYDLQLESDALVLASA